jgi:4-hydroxy-tetrahydrodipicolinate synthase
MSEGQTSNTHTPLLSGCLVALITPMTTTGSIDEEALRQLVQWHLKIGTHGLVPTGTTGESPVLSADEQHRVIEIVCDEVKGAIPVVAGCGSNNTHEALEHHAHAFDAGATAALHVTGYYNRPSQEGIYQHFKALNHLNPLPIIVYNIPARTNVDISVRTMAQLAALEHVTGVKDATKDLARPCLEKVAMEPLQKAFSFLSGEDGTAVAYNAAGGNGCISTTGNVAPEICVQIQNACQRGDFPEAIALQQKLTPLHEALFLEPSPAGVKYACSRRGLCTDTVRLPMISPGADTRHAIDAALERIEISTAQ